MPTEKIKLNELTGVRAVAAYLIFFTHFNNFSEKEYGGIPFGLLNEFHVGVTIFFVLSGFLICLRYYDNIIMRDYNWIVKYIQNRVARIFPMYFLLTTITFIIIYLDTPRLYNCLIQYLNNIFFLKGFFNQYKFTGIVQGWTLTVEECFYFSAPIIFLLSRKIKLYLIFLFIFLLGVMLVIIFGRLDYHGFFQNFRFMLVFTYFGRVFEFFVGTSLALLYKRKYQFQSGLKGYRTLIGILWIIICIMLLAIVRGKEEFGLDTPFGIVINNLILPVGIAFLFLGIILERTIVKRVLSSKLFILLGKSSYSFYLIHFGFLSKLINHYTDSLTIKFLLVNIIAIILYKYIEEPCNDFIRKFDFYQKILKIKMKLFYRT
jgi:peptidoglycan/LPS O-acetylase OafA/YrhL